MIHQTFPSSSGCKDHPFAHHRSLSKQHSGMGIHDQSERRKSLVGGWATPLKNRTWSIGMMTETHYMGKEKMATKPPTSFSRKEESHMTYAIFVRRYWKILEDWTRQSTLTKLTFWNFAHLIYSVPWKSDIGQKITCPICWIWMDWTPIMAQVDVFIHDDHALGIASFCHSLPVTSTISWFRPQPWQFKNSKLVDPSFLRCCSYYDWLVVGPPLWKIWKSIGMIRNPIYGKIKLMATKPPTRLRFPVGTLPNI